MRTTSLFFYALITLAFAPNLMADPRADAVFETQKFTMNELRMVPTFENASCYYYTSAPIPELRLQYRQTGTADWQTAPALVLDQPENLYKGSLFFLTSDTAYDVRLLDAADRTVADTSFQTWSDTPPIAQTINLAEYKTYANGAILIDAQGSPDGWIRVIAPPDFIAKPEHEKTLGQAAIHIRNAAFVIVENLTVTGGTQHAIAVEDSHHIRIRNCNISNWGTAGQENFDNPERLGQYMLNNKTVNYHAGVAILNSRAVVVERCYIHDPRNRANSWQFSHPAGPTAIYAYSQFGGCVVRYNDFVGSDEYRWNDVIEGGNNGGPTGGFAADSDIYGNLMVFANDDGTELEGGGMNLRFYNNRVEGTLCAVSTGACVVGPVYVYRNLFSFLGDETGKSAILFKNGHGTEQAGKRFFFHNTAYSNTRIYNSYGKPKADTRIAVAWNNLFAGSGSQSVRGFRHDDFNHNLFCTLGEPEQAATLLQEFRDFGMESAGQAADPLFTNPETGDFSLKSDSPARNCAVPVPGIMSFPDLGAIQGHHNMPVRPSLPATASTQRFVYDHGQGQTQTFTLTSTGATPLTLTLHKNRVCDFIRVTPETVTLQPGQTVTVSLEFIPAKVNGYPKRVGAFLFRAANGLSLPFTLSAQGDFDEEPLITAALKGQIRLTPTQPLRFGPNLKKFNEQFKITRPGRYYIVARAKIEDATTSGKDKPFAVTLNDTNRSEYAVRSNYVWFNRLGEERNAFFAALGELTAGTYDLAIEALSDSPLWIREFYITDQPRELFQYHYQRERR